MCLCMAPGDKGHMIPQGSMGNHSLGVPHGGKQTWIPALPDTSDTSGGT